MIKAYASTILAVPVDRVWDRVRNFNGLPDWHPAATDSCIEPGHNAGEVGCVRNFALTDGSGRIRETLLSISEPERCLSYDMLPGGPLPFVDYVSTMKFSEITDRGETFAQWWAEFEAGDGDSARWHGFVENEVFLGGFRALEASFNN
ncbi:SRPBCC family protein [Pseudooceanicola lipolyticus]|uniref:SRPBCC family protein n=1 Tax=Pseudooceanicola lipolyticus TaxID=2029104 RepID=A0A2M8J7H0_9RHOB|nr:SRPBCC family protein [Pseudooceanicola lipolyticus]PJE38722.1 SRPBCC family protein [Pseudooceanicola lipolyticus]